MSKNDSTVVLSRLLKLHPKIIDLSLDRVRRLLTKLDNPEKKLPPVVHIAGTNGKGSTLALIRAGLESEKKKVHTFTSPHLIRINERIVIAGSQISENMVYGIVMGLLPMIHVAYSLFVWLMSQENEM